MSSRQPNGSSSQQPRYVDQHLQTGVLILPSVLPPSERYPSGSQVNLMALLDDWLRAADGEVQQLDFLVKFISWIAHSDFLLLQQPEPNVGDQSATYPAAVVEQGIRGRSIYTNLFYHFDMETFTCKFCRHVVEGNLEDAITHQRTHFNHSPYQCLPNHTNWYVFFSFPWVRIKNAIFHSAGNGSQVKRFWGSTSSLMDTK